MCSIYRLYLYLQFDRVCIGKRGYNHPLEIYIMKSKKLKKLNLFNLPFWCEWLRKNFPEYFVTDYFFYYPLHTIENEGRYMQMYYLWPNSDPTFHVHVGEEIVYELKEKKGRRGVISKKLIILISENLARVHITGDTIDLIAIGSLVQIDVVTVQNLVVKLQVQTNNQALLRRFEKRIINLVAYFVQGGYIPADLDFQSVLNQVSSPDSP